VNKKIVNLISRLVGKRHLTKSTKCAKKAISVQTKSEIYVNIFTTPTLNISTGDLIKDNVQIFS
jgi:hypothetical protein